MEGVTHHATMSEREYTWVVDTAAVASIVPWARRQPAVLHADLAGMADAFPHWLLVGAAGGQLIRCPTCRAPAAPTEGAIHCVVCRAPQTVDTVVWSGQIPALARPEATFTRRSVAAQAAGFSEIEAAGLHYLLVPLRVFYPHEWPNEEPQVFYSTRWLDALGLPHGSGAHHLLAQGRACLFAWGQWQAQPVHAVLQQRMINHIASLLKIVAGQSPHQAFIGRIHQDEWNPER